jgi:hypothetical protein
MQSIKLNFMVVFFAFFLAVFSFSSFASTQYDVADFSYRTGAWQSDFVEENGRVAIFSFEGDLNYSESDNNSTGSARAYVARQFLDRYADKYDALYVFSDFSVDLDEAAARHWAVRRDVQGIGGRQFDNSQAFGSDSVLDSYIDMGSLSQWLASDPYVDKSNGANFSVLSVAMHELWHRWVFGVDIAGEHPELLRGSDNSHWSALLDNVGSVMYGANWSQVDDTKHKVTAVREGLSPLDLYMAGLYGPEEVGPIHYIQTGDVDPHEIPYLGLVAEGTRQSVSIQQLIEENGPRIPSHQDAQKEFEVAIVLLTRKSEKPAFEKVHFLNQFAAAFEDFVAQKTGGRAAIHFSLQESTLSNTEDSDDLVRERVDLDLALEWIKSTKKEGRWADSSETEIRDTATAQDVLTKYDESYQGRISDWLEGIDSVNNVDDLSYLILVGDSSRSGALAEFLKEDSGVSLYADHGATLIDMAVLIANAPRLIETPMIQFVYEHQNEDGGWGYRPGDESNVHVTAAILKAYSKLNVHKKINQESINQAFYYLSEALHSGLLGGEDNLVLYANYLSAAHLSEYELDALTSYAIDKIERSQLLNGSWKGSVYTTAQMVEALKSQNFSNIALDCQPAQESGFSIVAGELIEIDCTVSTDSKVVLEDVDIELYHLVEGEKQVIQDSLIPSISAVAGYEINFIVDSRDYPDLDRFYIEVNATKTYAESTRLDNHAMFDIDYVDGEGRVDFALYKSDTDITPLDLSQYKETIQVSGVVRKLAGTLDDQAILVIESVEKESTIRLAEIPLVFLEANLANFQQQVEVVNADFLSVFIDTSVDNNLANNQIRYAFNKLDTFDFVVESVISATDGPRYINEDTEVQVAISNQGLSPSGTIDLTLDVLNSGQLVSSEVRSFSLAAGDEVLSSFVLKVNQPGTYQVRAVADWQDLVLETNESNNSMTRDIEWQATEGPNLQLSDDSISGLLELEQAHPAEFTVHIANNGAESSDPTVLIVKDRLSPDEVLGAVQVPSISPASQVTVDLLVDSMPYRGDRTLDFYVDPDNSIDEFSEEDNQAFINVEVASLADFSISDVVGTLPQYPSSSEPFELTFKISNLGDQEVDQVNIQFVTDTGLEETISISDLAAKTFAVQSFTIPAYDQNIAEVNYQLWVDFDDQVLEVSEDNNLLSGKIIYDASLLYLSEKIISPNSDGKKDSVQVRYECPDECELLVFNKAGVEIGAITQNSSVFTWFGDVDGQLLRDGLYHISLINQVDNSLVADNSIIIDTNMASVLDNLGQNRAKIQNLYDVADRIAWIGFNEYIGKYVFYVDRDDDLDDGSLAVGMYTLGTNDDDPKYLTTMKYVEWFYGDESIESYMSDEYFYGIYETYNLKTGEKIDVDGRRPHTYEGRIGNGQVFKYLGETYYLGYSRYELGPECGLSRIDNFNEYVSIDSLFSIYDDNVYSNQDCYYAMEDGWLSNIPFNIVDGTLYAARFELSLADGGGEVYPETILYSAKTEAFSLKLHDDGILDILDRVRQTHNRIDLGQYYDFDIENPSVYVEWSASKEKITLYYHGNRYYRRGEVEALSLSSSSVSEFVLPGEENGIMIHIDLPSALVHKTASLIQPVFDEREYDYYIADEPVQYFPYESNREIERARSAFSDPVKENLNRNYGFSNYFDIEFSDLLATDVAPLLVPGKNGVYLNEHEYLDFSHYANVGKLVDWVYDTNNYFGMHFHPSVVHNLDLKTVDTVGNGIGIIAADMRENGALIVSSGVDKRAYLQEKKENLQEDLDEIEMLYGVDYLTLDDFNVSTRRDKYINAKEPPNDLFVGVIKHFDNLFIGLNFDTRSVSGVGITVTAYDQHADTYELYYKQVEENSWNILSELEAVRAEEFRWGLWTPPVSGSYEVKLVVNDKAGNKKTLVKPIIWGEQPDITNIRLSDFKISPNADGLFDQATISYDVNRPTYTRIQVHNQDNGVVYQEVLTNANPVQDYQFTWDGRDSDGLYLPDGLYKIFVNDAEFVLIIDTQGPLVEDISSTGHPIILSPTIAYQIPEDVTDLESVRITANVDGERREVAVRYGRVYVPGEEQSININTVARLMDLDIHIEATDDVANTFSINMVGSGLFDRIYMNLMADENGELEYTRLTHFGNVSFFPEERIYGYVFPAAEELYWKVDNTYLAGGPLMIELYGKAGVKSEAIPYVMDTDVAYVKIEDVDKALNELIERIETASGKSLQLQKINDEVIRFVTVNGVVSSYYNHDRKAPGSWVNFKGRMDSGPADLRYHRVPSSHITRAVSEFQIEVSSTQDERYVSPVQIFYADSMQSKSIELSDLFDIRPCTQYSIKHTALNEESRTFIYSSSCIEFETEHLPSKDNIAQCNATADYIRVRFSVSESTKKGSVDSIQTYRFKLRAFDGSAHTLTLSDFFTKNSNFLDDEHEIEIEYALLQPGLKYFPVLEMIDKEGNAKEVVDREYLKIDVEIPRIVINEPVQGGNYCYGDGIYVRGAIYDTAAAKVARDWSYRLRSSKILDDIKTIDFNHLDDGYLSVMQGELGKLMNIDGHQQIQLTAYDPAFNKACTTLDFYVDGKVGVDAKYQSYELENIPFVSNYQSLESGLREYPDSIHAQIISPNGDGVFDDLTYKLSNSEPVVVEVESAGQVIYIDDISTTDPGYSLHYVPGTSFASLADGYHELTFRFSDECGNTKSYPVPLVIDRIPPKASIVFPVVSNDVLKETPFIINNYDRHLTSFELLSEVADENSVYERSLYKGDQLRVNELAEIINMSPFDGDVRFKLVVTDAAGNTALDYIDLFVGNLSNLILSLDFYSLYLSPNNDNLLDSLKGIVSVSRSVNYDITIGGGSPTYQGTILEGVSAIEVPSVSLLNLTDGTKKLEFSAALIGNENVTESIDLEVIIDTKLPQVTLSIDEEWVAIAKVADANLSEAECELTRENETLAQYKYGNAQTSSGLVNINLTSQLDQDGEYLLHCLVRDFAENRLEYEQAFFVDKTAPVVDVKPSDELIIINPQETELSLSVSVEDASDYQILINLSDNQLITTDLGVTAGEYSLLLADFSDAEYTLSVSVIDAYGNATNIMKTLILDATPPELQLPDQNYITPGAQYAFDVVDANLKQVNVYSGSRLLSGSTTESHVVITWPNNLVDGEYPIQIEAVDAIENITQVEVELIQDTIPPVAVTDLSAEYPSSSELLVSWSPSTSNDVDYYEVYVNDNYAGKTQNILFSHPVMEEETVFVHVIAFDFAGNESLDNPVFELVIDLEPPVISLAQPMADELFSDALSVKGYVTDEHLKNTRVTLLNPMGIAVFEQEFDGDSFATEIDTGAYDGTYQVVVFAEDDYENESEVEVSVVFDNTPPQPPTSLSVSEIDASQGQYQLTWQHDSVAEEVTYEVWKSSELFSNGIDGLEHEFTEEIDGVYRYTVVAVDSMSNRSNPSNVAVLQIENRLPEIELISPEEGDGFDRILQVTVAPIDYDIASISLELYDPAGALVGSTEAYSILEEVNLTLDTADIAYGPYEMAVYATDLNGQLGNPIRIALVKQDIISPQPVTDLQVKQLGNALEVSWAPSISVDVASYAVIYMMDGYLLSGQRIDTPEMLTTTLKFDQLSDGVLLSGIDVEVYAIDESYNESIAASAYQSLIQVPIGIFQPYSPFYEETSFSVLGINIPDSGFVSSEEGDKLFDVSLQDGRFDLLEFISEPVQLTLNDGSNESKPLPFEFMENELPEISIAPTVYTDGIDYLSFDKTLFDTFDVEWFYLVNGVLPLSEAPVNVDPVIFQILSDEELANMPPELSNQIRLFSAFSLIELGGPETIGGFSLISYDMNNEVVEKDAALIDEIYKMNFIGNLERIPFSFQQETGFYVFDFPVTGEAFVVRLKRPELLGIDTVHISAWGTSLVGMDQDIPISQFDALRYGLEAQDLDISVGVRSENEAIRISSEALTLNAHDSDELPEILLNAALDDTHVVLSWTHQEALYEQYLLYQNDEMVQLIDGVGASDFSISVPGYLGANNFYLVGLVPSGLSKSSNEVSVFIDQESPLTVENLYAVYDEPAHEVALSWDSVEGASYEVYRWHYLNSGYQLIGSSSDPLFVDDTVQYDSYYEYYVVAVGSLGVTSPPSNLVKVVTAAIDSDLPIFLAPENGATVAPNVDVMLFGDLGTQSKVNVDGVNYYVTHTDLGDGFDFETVKNISYLFDLEGFLHYSDGIHLRSTTTNDIVFENLSSISVNEGALPIDLTAPSQVKVTDEYIYLYSLGFDSLVEISRENRQAKLIGLQMQIFDFAFYDAYNTLFLVTSQGVAYYRPGVDDEPILTPHFKFGISVSHDGNNMVLLDDSGISRVSIEEANGELILNTELIDFDLVGEFVFWAADNQTLVSADDEVINILNVATGEASTYSIDSYDAYPLGLFDNYFVYADSNYLVNVLDLHSLEVIQQYSSFEDIEQVFPMGLEMFVTRAGRLCVFQAESFSSDVLDMSCANLQGVNSVEVQLSNELNHLTVGRSGLTSKADNDSLSLYVDQPDQALSISVSVVAGTLSEPSTISVMVENNGSDTYLSDGAVIRLVGDDYLEDIPVLNLPSQIDPASQYVASLDWQAPHAGDYYATLQMNGLTSLPAKLSIYNGAAPELVVSQPGDELVIEVDSVEFSGIADLYVMFTFGSDSMEHLIHSGYYSKFSEHTYSVSAPNGYSFNERFDARVKLVESQTDDILSEVEYSYTPVDDSFVNLTGSLSVSPVELSSNEALVVTMDFSVETNVWFNGYVYLDVVKPNGEIESLYSLPALYWFDEHKFYERLNLPYSTFDVGVNQLRLTIQDNDGNLVATDTQSFVVQEAFPDLKAVIDTNDVVGVNTDFTISVTIDSISNNIDKSYSAFLYVGDEVLAELGELTMSQLPFINQVTVNSSLLILGNNLIELHLVGAEASRFEIASHLVHVTDIHPPVIDAQELNNLTYVNASSFINFSVTDEHSGLKQVQLVAGDESVDYEYSYNYEYRFSNQEDGAFQIQITAEDNAGNVATTDVKTLIKDSVAPIVSIEGVDDGAAYNTDITLLASVEDEYLDHADFKINTVESDLGEHTLTGDGVYLASIEAYDLAGNFSYYRKSFVIDQSLPSLVVEGVTDGQLINESVIYQVSCEEENISTFEVTLNGVMVSNEGEVDIEGNHVLSIECSDIAGNSISDSLHFEIDLTNPELPIVIVGDGSEVLQDAQQEIRIESELGSDVFLSLNDGPVSRYDVTTGFYEGQISLVEGENQIRYWSQDEAGNLSVENVMIVTLHSTPDIKVSLREIERYKALVWAPEWTHGPQHDRHHVVTFFDKLGIPYDLVTDRSELQEAMRINKYNLVIAGERTHLFGKSSLKHQVINPDLTMLIASGVDFVSLDRPSKVFDGMLDVLGFKYIKGGVYVKSFDYVMLNGEEIQVQVEEPGVRVYPASQATTLGKLNESCHERKHCKHSKDFRYPAFIFNQYGQGGAMSSSFDYLDTVTYSESVPILRNLIDRALTSVPSSYPFRDYSIHIESPTATDELEGVTYSLNFNDAYIQASVNGQLASVAEQFSWDDDQISVTAVEPIESELTVNVYYNNQLIQSESITLFADLPHYSSVRNQLGELVDEVDFNWFELPGYLALQHLITSIPDTLPATEDDLNEVRMKLRAGFVKVEILFPEVKEEYATEAGKLMNIINTHSQNIN